jgi:hypothetical protein
MAEDKFVLLTIIFLALAIAAAMGFFLPHIIKPDQTILIENHIIKPAQTQLIENIEYGLLNTLITLAIIMAVIFELVLIEDAIWKAKMRRRLKGGIPVGEGCKQPAMLAVIADTHLGHLDKLPPGLMPVLAKADLVIHLGDYSSRGILDDLRKLDNFYGIAGNHDDDLVRHELKGMEILQVDGKQLGLFHGFLLPFAGQKRMKVLFKEYKIDAILYGHTHFAISKSIDDVFVFNPGSVTGSFPANYASFGLLTLDGSISGEIVYLEKTHKIAGGFLGQFATMLLQRVVCWVETWPYPDFPQYMAKTRPALRKSFLALKELFAGERRRNNFSPSK